MLKKYVILMMATLMVICASSVAMADEHVCDFKFMAVSAEPDCVNPGQEWWHCDCGADDMRTVAKDEDNHNFVNGVCTRCGEEEELEFVPDQKPDNGNKPSKKPTKRCKHEWIVGAEVEANCKYEGSIVYMCAKGCGKEYTETTEINRKNHNYNDDNVCVNCGKAKRCKHEWIVGAEVEANCKYEGSVVYMCAKGCGAEYTETTPVDHKNHNYGDDNTCVDCGKVKRCRHEWIVGAEVEANCKYEGSIVYMCAKGCGAEYTETTEINRKNHNYGDDNVCVNCGKAKRCRHEWIVGYEVEANCTYEGAVGYMCAKGCGAEYEETTEINRKNHNYNDDNVCVNCGKAKRCRHEWIVGYEVEANCTYEGAVGYMCAKGCGAEYEETTEINPRNHNYGDDKVCDDCGNIKRSRRELKNDWEEPQKLEDAEESETQDYEYIDETEDTERAGRRGRRGSRSRDAYLTGND